MPGDEKIYNSYDKIICEHENQINDYPVEFLIPILTTLFAFESQSEKNNASKQNEKQAQYC